MTYPRPQTGAGRRPDTVKRAAILAAAQQLFAEHGFTATSMDAVARGANTSKLTAYRHFGSKDELFAAAIAARCEAMLPITDSDDWHSDDAQAALTAFGLAFLDLILHPNALAIHRLIIAERDRAPQLGALFHASAIVPTQMRLANLIERLGLSLTDPMAAASDLLALWRSKPMLPIEMGLPQWSHEQKGEHISRSVNLCLGGWAAMHTC